MNRGLRALAVAMACMAVSWAVPAPSLAGNLYKCGATFQDKPCESRDVQQRFSRTSGEFSIDQVNPNTDKDCARAAGNLMPYWERLAAGESLETLKAEIDAKPVSRYEKSRMRDVLIALRGYKGEPVRVRSEFEAQCMAYKRRRGYPTERELASGASSALSESEERNLAQRRSLAAAEQAEIRAREAQQRARIRAERAARAAERP